MASPENVFLGNTLDENNPVLRNGSRSRDLHPHDPWE